jgi:MOSC domain-containing protein YiiM
MRLLSVNVGMPREIARSRGKPTFSAIFKEPAEGPVFVGKLNLEGDKQADPAVHGGGDKAVYAYPSEHYEYWKGKFPGMDMPWGTFGENLTTEGLMEEAVHAGDSFVIGSVELAVTQPRLPCFKLGIRFETNAIIRLFLESERTGFYLKVLREGTIEAGDVIKRVQVNPGLDTITTMVRAVKRRG